MAAQSSDRSVNALFDLITAHRVTAIVYVAAKLGIADLIVESARTPTELAQLTGAHERSIHRLLRALVALGICVEGPGAKFALTEMGTHLAARSERSLKANVLCEGELLTAGWMELIESVRTGKTGAQLAGAGEEQFERFAEAGLASLFNEAMASITRAILPDILAAYDFAGIAKLMDAGGGFGQLLAAILKRHPSMRGVVFDLPHCADGARKNFVEAGVADRAEFIGGNFFESIPSGVADAIVMKSIIHDWNDERCVRLLQNCRRALKPGARLIVIDRIMPEKIEPKAEHLAAVLSDLNMLRGPGGSERTEREHRELLVNGGFQMTRCVHAGRIGVIEATAA